MSKCTESGCRNLQTTCVDCGRVVCTKELPASQEWIKFEIRKFNPFIKDFAPFDGIPFLACIWGEWVGEAIYARHYDSEDDRIPGKYEFFYITENPENKAWKLKIEEDPFPITHWMSLPKLPEKS